MLHSDLAATLLPSTMTLFTVFHTIIATGTKFFAGRASWPSSQKNKWLLHPPPLLLLCYEENDERVIIDMFGGLEKVSLIVKDKVFTINSSRSYARAMHLVIKILLE